MIDINLMSMNTSTINHIQSKPIEPIKEKITYDRRQKKYVDITLFPAKDRTYNMLTMPRVSDTIRFGLYGG